MTLALAFLGLIVLLHAADVVTTAIGLKRGFEEANPLARALFGRLGTLPTAILLKIVLTLPMAALAIFYPSWWPVPALYAASLVWVVWHNVKMVRSGDQ